jgi:hypothetical protein
LLTVNRKVIEERATLSDSNPSFIVDMADAGLSAKRVAVIGEDTFRKQIELLNCTVHKLSGPDAPVSTFLVHDGRLRIVTKGPKAKAVYVFMGPDYVGSIAGETSAFDVDVRTVPSGLYPLYTVSESESGAVTLPVSTTFAIPPRYRITSSATSETFGVEKDTISLPVHIEKLPECEASKVRVLLDNKSVGEYEMTSFDIKLNMAEIPSGEAELTLIGSGKDGQQLPPETFELKVENYFLNTTGLTQNLQADMRRIQELGQQIEYYYTKAMTERDTVTQNVGSLTSKSYDSNGFAQYATTSIINSITVTPGKQAEYLATCRKYIVERAQVRLRIAQAYKQMGRLRAFRRACLQIVREAGATSALGRSAMQMLNEG